jgi:hypothetical protein
VTLTTNSTLRGAAAVLALGLIAGCTAGANGTPEADQQIVYQPTGPTRTVPQQPNTLEPQTPPQLAAPSQTQQSQPPPAPQTDQELVTPDPSTPQETDRQDQTPPQGSVEQDAESWWDIVREPLAPQLGDRAALVLSHLPLYGEPSVAVTVEADPSIPGWVVADTVAVLDTLVRLLPDSQMTGVEILITADRQWIADRIAASERILEVERQAFLSRLADGSTGEAFNYSLRGPNFEQTIVTMIAPHDLTRTVIAESVARELSPNLVSVYATGVAGDPWPCWAAEGLGYPLAWEATRRTFGGTYRQYRDFWVSQLRERTELTLGLAASEAFRGTPESPCFTGAGHLQGALAGELIVVEHGVEGLFTWAKASWGRSWRDGYVEVFAETVEAFYVRFARDAIGELR